MERGEGKGIEQDGEQVRQNRMQHTEGRTERRTGVEPERNLSRG